MLSSGISVFVSWPDNDSPKIFLRVPGWDVVSVEGDVEEGGVDPLDGNVWAVEREVYVFVHDSS